MKQPINIRLDKGLLSRLDKAAEEDHRNRTNLIEVILEAYLEGFTPAGKEKK